MTARVHGKNWGLRVPLTALRVGGRGSVCCSVSHPPTQFLLFLLSRLHHLLRNSRYMLLCCCAVSKLCLTLWHHELQHATLPCLSLSYRVCSNSCPLSWGCHPTISSSVAPFSCLQSFPTSGPFPVSQLFTSGGQIWSFSFSISPSNKYSGLISIRIDWFDLFAVQGTLRSLQHHS